MSSSRKIPKWICYRNINYTAITTLLKSVIDNVKVQCYWNTKAIEKGIHESVLKKKKLIKIKEL